MSHLKERKEKNCLNCNAVVQGRYCHICGQENVETKESAFHLVTHFFKDITHFDGKFFTSIKQLLFRPGYLAGQYLSGRRASHLDPARMYIFTSAFFFLIFFTFYQEKKESISYKVNTTAAGLMSQLNNSKMELDSIVNHAASAAERDSAKAELADVLDDIAALTKDSTAKDKLKSISYNFNVISFSGGGKKNYTTLKEYDSLQKILPANERDGWIEKKVERHNLYLKEKYNGDSRAILQSIKNDFVHRFPQMLFVSLPFFALLLKLLYRRKRNVYYVNHAVFAIHLYCAMFLIILASLWLGSIFGWFGGKLPGWLNGLFTIGAFFYLYKALRNFYGQRRAKTVLKYILLLFLSLIVMIIIFSFFFIFSTFAI